MGRNRANRSRGDTSLLLYAALDVLRDEAGQNTGADRKEGQCGFRRNHKCRNIISEKSDTLTYNHLEGG